MRIFALSVLLLSACLSSLSTSTSSSSSSGLTTAETTATAEASSNEISLQIINDSRSSFQVYWVNPDDDDDDEIGSYIKLTNEPREPKSITSFATFAGHEFELRELPQLENGECNNTVDKTCRRALLKLPEHREGEEGKFCCDLGSFFFLYFEVIARIWLLSTNFLQPCK